jgi:hypothetical protein
MELAVSKLTKHQLDEAVAELHKTIPVVKVQLSDPSIGNWTMTRLWFSWMNSTAKWMAARGSRMPIRAEINGKTTMNFFHEDAVIVDWRPFNETDAHEAFAKAYLGTDNSGKRYSWSKSKDGDKVQADKGQRYWAMCKHQVYMIEKGIEYLDPKDSEFRKLCESMGYE